ncbi:Mariner Mos1 transposase [Eumeta japonica]|uniref:Mariner Mos1 transposase n=1 Tax=Eumeta variegata TaxID=151549 RepID=A0A4C1U6I3_EUMVA|nr:Mariner Mos1 transposase [Eumeta japonica]
MEEDNGEKATKVAKQRILRCLDWFLKQSSEGPKRNMNLNDIDFIVETNKDRRNFMLSSVDDDTSVPAAVDEVDVKPVAVPIHKLREESLRLECEWRSCDTVTTNYELFQKHVIGHTRDLHVITLEDRRRESCEDDPRPGRPVTVVTEENVRKIEKLVLADRRIKLWQIAEELQISKERVGEIIHEHMNMRKSAREAVVQSDVEVIARSAVLQDNASVHTARVSRQALKDTGFSEIDHPPYSPDLAPSDYFLFSNLKKELRGRRFVDDNQMKMAVESHFDCKEKEYFLGGLKALYTRCEKCISLEGDYIEK